jgi:hypothetical protein
MAGSLKSSTLSIAAAIAPVRHSRPSCLLDPIQLLAGSLPLQHQSHTETPRQQSACVMHSSNVDHQYKPPKRTHDLLEAGNIYRAAVIHQS